MTEEKREAQLLGKETETQSCESGGACRMAGESFARKIVLDQIVCDF